MVQRLGIEEALDIAMDGEVKAQAFYGQAALEIEDPAGRDLLGRLAAFEQHHYQKLLELADSLRSSGGGKFIAYEERTLQHFDPLVSRGEAARSLLQELKDVPGILSKAIDNEKLAELRYRLLAEQTADPDGQDMFKKLANEERLHQRVLEDEFFSLSNRGVWGWQGMYGE